VLSGLICRKERKWWKANCYVLAERPENSDGGCGIVAGRFPVLRADLRRYAPTTPWDGAGGRPGHRCERQKCIRTCKLEPGFHLPLRGHHGW